jgi:hypothetical protein
MEKFLEGLHKTEDGRYRLIETMILDSSRYTKLSMKESVVKDQNGTQYPVRSCYEFKIWDTNFNLNGRNYGKVFNKVIQEKSITLGFSNHPEDGKEDVTKTYSVQKNPHIKEGWLCVDVYFVGESGRLAEEILEVGGPIAVSSSALGDLDDKGNVLEEGFELERYGDWVWQGANNQLQFRDDVITETKEEKSIEKEVTILKEDTDDHSQGVEKMDTFMEKNIVINVKRMMKEAMKEEDLGKRLESLQEAYSFTIDLTDKTIQNDLNDKIKNTEKAMNDLAKKGESVDSLTEEIEKQNKKIQEMEVFYKELEEKYNESVKVYEASAKKEKEIIEKFDETIESLKKEIEKLTEEKELIEAEANTKVDPEIYLKLKHAYFELKEKSISRHTTPTRERREEILNNIRTARKNKKTFFKDRQVESYFNDLVRSNKDFKEYQSVFEECRSLEEAQKFVMDDREEDSKIQRELIESTKKPEKKPSSFLESYLKENNLR